MNLLILTLGLILQTPVCRNEIALLTMASAQQPMRWWRTPMILAIRSARSVAVHHSAWTHQNKRSLLIHLLRKSADEQCGWVLVAIMLDITEEQAFKAIWQGWLATTRSLAQRLTETYFYLAKASPHEWWLRECYLFGHQKLAVFF